MRIAFRKFWYHETAYPFLLILFGWLFWNWIEWHPWLFPMNNSKKEVKSSLHFMVTPCLWQKGLCLSFFRRQPCIVYDMQFTRISLFKWNSNKNVQLLWSEFSARYALSRHMDGYALARVKDCDFGAKCTERWGQDRVLASIVVVFYISRSAERNLFVPNTVVTVFMVVYIYGGQS